MPTFVCCRVGQMSIPQMDEECFGLMDWRDREWICLELTPETETFANLEIARMTHLVAQEFFDEDGAIFHGRVGDRNDLKYALARVECIDTGGIWDLR